MVEGVMVEDMIVEGMMVEEGATFAIAERISWNDVGDELALFDGESGGYFALNGPAVAIWRELARGQSVGAATDALAERFDAPRAVIAADIADFVKNALDRGLLVAR